ncbi:MAG: HD domain-containing protein, partial [Bryobacteraceae bacterium]
RDFYHRYTVDEHTLVTIQNLRDLGDRTDTRLKDVWLELERRGLLVFALLFHDAGKGVEGEGHVDASLKLVEGAMHRIGMPEADREMVRFLIARHLDLSETMHSRDMDEASTIEALARRVGTVERLKALTLLTWADISAVNPSAMTPWRQSQLFRLHLHVHRELTRELDTDRIRPQAASDAVTAAFVEGFPTRYLRTHTPQEVQEHIGLRLQLGERGVVADLHKLGGGTYRLTLLAIDREFLFASVAGTLASFGMNILKAEAFGNRRGEVLDTFIFEDPSRTLELNPSESERLTSTVERVVLGTTDVRQLLRTRPKAALPSRGARLEPSVSFDPETSPTATLIQVVTQDRPGLLYELAAAMSGAGCSIDVVLIDTEAHKAIDVFYVTAGGRKLDESTQDQL